MEASMRRLVLCLTYPFVVQLAVCYQPNFVIVPAGTFMMGCNDIYSWEQPVHQVSLGYDILLGIHEVTNSEYVVILQWAYDQGHVVVDNGRVLAFGEVLLYLNKKDLASPHSFCEITFRNGRFSLGVSRSISIQNAHPEGYDPGSHPVKCISWYGAACYCDWISEMEGLQPFYNGNWDQTEEHNPYTSLAYRLPTEAEWEYAAQYDDGRMYPWGDTDPNCDLANYWPRHEDECISWTLPVGSYPLGESKLGLMDMVGNVAEWVGDWYGDYSNEPLNNPLGPAKGTDRVLRGGEYDTYGSEGIRCKARSSWLPG